MSDRSVIWFRDALVIILAIYVVSSVAFAPWANLKYTDSLSNSCETGCAPLIVFPDDGYYHYKDEITFEWKSVSVEYNFILKGDNDNIITNENITNQYVFTTSKLLAGNYTTYVYFKGISGTYTSEENSLLVFDEHQLTSPSKITLAWSPVTITYNLQIKLEKDSEILPIYQPVIHEVEGLELTTYEFSDFEAGKTYYWSVKGVVNFSDSVGNSLGYVSEASSERELNIDTTKFLALVLFNDWDLPFILLGVLMVIALQAGVFLAREEKND